MPRRVVGIRCRGCRPAVRAAARSVSLMLTQPRLRLWRCALGAQKGFRAQATRTTPQGGVGALGGKRSRFPGGRLSAGASQGVRITGFSRYTSHLR